MEFLPIEEIEEISLLSLESEVGYFEDDNTIGHYETLISDYSEEDYDRLLDEAYDNILDDVLEDTIDEAYEIDPWDDL